jgi:hypothetical protein
MSSAAKKSKIATLVSTCTPVDIHHRKNSADASRRGKTSQFHLKTVGVHSTLQHVCKKMFLQTFALKKATVLQWISSTGMSGRVSKNKE